MTYISVRAEFQSQFMMTVDWCHLVAINYTIWFTAVATVHIASAMDAEMYEVGMRVRLAYSISLS